MKMPLARIKWSCDSNVVEFGYPNPLQNPFQGVKREGEGRKGRCGTERKRSAAGRSSGAQQVAREHL
jgi:hypothetical protein